MERVTPWIDFASRIFTVIALVAGGVWAYYQFMLAGADDWVINLNISTEVLPYNQTSKLLFIHLNAKNPLAHKIEIPSAGGYYHVTVRKLSDKLPPGAAINEDSGTVLADINLLAEGGDEFLPSAEFDDSRAVIVPNSSLLTITAEIHAPNGDKSKKGRTDYDFVNAIRVVNTGP